jgi:hypothetical protein
MAAEISRRYRIADVCLDLGQRRLWRGTEAIALSSRLFTRPARREL